MNNPIKSENLPGCAVQMGSVAGIIGGKDIKVSVIWLSIFNLTGSPGKLLGVDNG